MVVLSRWFPYLQILTEVVRWQTKIPHYVSVTCNLPYSCVAVQLLSSLIISDHSLVLYGHNAAFESALLTYDAVGTWPIYPLDSTLPF